MARDARLTAIIVLLFMVLFIVSAPPILAADYINCGQNSTCTVGEFLYDDNYTPIATASCTLTTRDPGGSLLFDNVGLTAHNDGWYDRDIDTTNYSAGLYRTQICCTHLNEYLCIDKSFAVNLTDLSVSDIENAVWNASSSSHSNPGSLGATVQNPPINPSDIWNYPTRTLTGFGSLVADVWSYTSRSLTGFGSLVTSIWSHDNRSLTTQNLDTGTLATTADVTNAITSVKSHVNWRVDSAKDTINSNVNAQVLDIKNSLATLSGTPVDNDTLNRIYAQVLENRDVLEALVNEPIVKTFIDESPPPDLQTKIDTTKATTNELFATTQQVISRLGVVNAKLAQLSPSALTTELNEISTLLNNPQNPGSSVTGFVAWIENAWGYRVAGDLSRETGETLAAVKLAQSHLLGATTVDSARVSLLTALEAGKRLETWIGDVSNTASDATLFGHLVKVQALAAKLNQNEEALNTLLSHWLTEPPLNKDKEILQLENQVMNVNQLSNAQSLLNDTGNNLDSRQKNKVLGLKAVTGINRLLMAKMAGESFSNIWLEEGSVIFRALVINPSERISQKVPLKYYLPREVRESDIMKHDDALTVKYDANEGAVYVEGEFNLSPGESRTFMVEVNDIFAVSVETINSLRAQANELLKPLQKTSYYGQGATIKSDIDVMLDKILERQASAQTPEGRIRAYRENQIELAGVKQKLDQLKTLVADAGSTNSIFGFVGGIQAVALWGIVIIVIAGFVFLSIYLKILRKEAYTAAGYTPAESRTASRNTHEVGWPVELIQRYTDRLGRLKDLPHLDAGTRFFQLIFIILTVSVFTVIIVTTIMYNPTAKTNSLSQIPKEGNVLSTNVLVLPAESAVYDAPSTTKAPVYTTLKDIPVTLLKTENGFSLVKLPDSYPVKHGWITQNSLTHRIINPSNE